MESYPPEEFVDLEDEEEGEEEEEFVVGVRGKGGETHAQNWVKFDQFWTVFLREAITRNNFQTFERVSLRV